MATSVKMDEETKTQLERLQAEIRLKTDQRVTQQELLTRLVETATESKADFIDSFRPNRVPASDQQRAKFHDGRISSGVTTTEDDIDEILYG